MASKSRVRARTSTPSDARPAPVVAPTPPVEPPAPDPWAVRPVAFAYYAREALRQRLVELRWVPVPFPLSRVLLDEDGKACITAETPERQRQDRAAFDRWQAADRHFCAAWRLVFGDLDGDQFRGRREPQLRAALLAAGIDADEAGRVSRDAVTDLLRYHQAGLPDRLPGGVCVCLRPAHRWAEDTTTLARIDPPLTVEYYFAELRHHAGHSAPNPFHVPTETPQDPPERAGEPSTEFTAEAVAFTRRHVLHLLDTTRLIAGRFAQERADPDGFDFTANMVDELRAACPIRWATDGVKAQLVTIRGSQFELLDGRIVENSVHAAIVELARCLFRSNQAAAFATIRSAGAEFDRMAFGPYHPTELPRMAGWMRANRPELLATLDWTGYQRLTCDVERESAELAKSCPSGPEGGTGGKAKRKSKKPSVKPEYEDLVHFVGVYKTEPEGSKKFLMRRFFVWLQKTHPQVRRRFSAEQLHEFQVWWNDSYKGGTPKG